MLSVLLPLCVALRVGAVDPTSASPSSPSSAAASTPGARGSVQGFADDLAAAIQQRAVAEGLHGGVRVVLDEIRGLDGPRVRAALWPRVRKALKGGPLIAVDNGAIVATVALSEERGQLWAVVVLDGPTIAAPTTLVVKRVLDRELEVALGTVSRLLPGRFVLERVGSLPPADPGRVCAVFDLTLVDIDGDLAQELAVLSACGLSVYRVDDGGLVLVGGPFALPPRRWPRVALGWAVTMSALEVGPIVWAATSAGHSVFVEVKTGRIVEAPGDRVPLRGVPGNDGPHALHWRLGSPVLALPLVTPGGIDVLVPGLPSRVRDIARLPGSEGWVFVSEDGTLVGRDEAGIGGALAPERVGDRLLVVDLDADGDVEILTTTSASPGEADQLVVRRLTPSHESTTVVLKSPLSGGSVAAFSAGQIDLDRRLDVVVVEELQDGGATVWRLEHSP